MFLYGDNLKVLPCIRDESIDLVLTDPQYGIGFMAKVWDQELPHAQAWAECFRVLKPGGFILVMASPRNDDLVSVSLREAGFIKHNSIYWVYGSGFPKGTDVSKAIDKKAIRAWLAERDHGLTSSEVEKVISAAVNGEVIEAGDTSLMSGMSGQKGSRERERDRTVGARLIERIEAEFGEMPKRVKVGTRPWAYPDSTVRTEPKNVSSDGYFQSEEKHTDLGNLPITAPATALAAEWEGFKYGVQHLKPASEVILVFQKPYDGTPLESILKWGVGAVNVDAGRIATGPEGLIKGGCTKIGGLYDMGMKGKEPINKEGHSQGRYPSNFLVSHLPGCRVVGEKRVKGGTAIHSGGVKATWGTYGEFPEGGKDSGYADADGKETVKEWECIEGCPVAELDRQSGERPSTGKYLDETHINKTPFRLGYKERSYEQIGKYSGDTGGASRFFHQPEWGPADFIYIPKASSAERNAGCEDLVIPEYRWNRAGICQQIKDRKGNFHPTVKPVELFRYLIRLYCGHNPNPVVGDFFAGSGTTEIAGILEGVKTLSIENEWEYCEIAEARSRYWLKNRSTYLTEKRLPKYQPKLPLFEEE